VIGVSFAYQVYTLLLITDAILDAVSLDGEGATAGQQSAANLIAAR
jgi:hypothetical protein